MRGLIRQFAKFSVVGVLAFAIDYALLAFFTEVCGIDYLISATLSYALSTVFNYLASMRYVFRHKEGMGYFKEFTIFVVLSLIGLLWNDLLMYVGVDVIGGHYLFVKIVVSAIVSLWNFFTRRKFLHAGDAPAEGADEGVREGAGENAHGGTHGAARENAEISDIADIASDIGIPGAGLPDEDPLEGPLGGPMAMFEKIAGGSE